MRESADAAGGAKPAGGSWLRFGGRGLPSGAELSERAMRALLAAGDRLLAMRKRAPKPALYAIGVLAGAMAFAARYAFLDFDDLRFPYLLSFPVVVLCSGVLGVGPALAAASAAGLLPFWVLVAPDDATGTVADFIGTVVYMLISLLVVGSVEVLGLAHAQAQEHGRERDALLVRAERLLHELRHRTRNELMQIVSLLHLQAREATSAEEKRSLVAMVARVRAVGAVHDLLSDMMPHPDAPVDSRRFLAGLLAKMAALAPSAAGPVGTETELESHALAHTTATPLGVVLAELYSNCAKHGFPAGHEPRLVRVRFRREETARGPEYVLEVEDDGIGIHASQAALDAAPGIKPRRGIGERVVKGLALNLKATLRRCERKPDAGTLCVLRFPVPAPPKAAAAAPADPPEPPGLC